MNSGSCRWWLFGSWKTRRDRLVPHHLGVSARLALGGTAHAAPKAQAQDGDAQKDEPNLPAEDQDLPEEPANNPPETEGTQKPLTPPNGAKPGAPPGRAPGRAAGRHQAGARQRPFAGSQAGGAASRRRRAGRAAGREGHPARVDAGQQLRGQGQMAPAPCRPVKSW